MRDQSESFPLRPSVSCTAVSWEPTLRKVKRMLAAVRGGESCSSLYCLEATVESWFIYKAG